jgi:hypothetical protein
MTEPLRICYVGNSMTFYNDLPHLVETILAPNLLEGGMEIAACLRGGRSLKTIWEQGADMARANACIGNKGMVETVEQLFDAPSGWDVIVLNDFTQHPARPECREESLNILKDRYIPAINAMAGRSGKTPLTLFYSTWGYAAPAKKSEEIGDFKLMSRKLAGGIFSYAALFQDSGLRAGIVEVGAAAEAVHDRDKDLWASLYQPDNFHPKPLGSFLIACVFAATITRHPVLSHRFSGCRINPAWPEHIQCCGPVVADDPDYFKNLDSLPEDAASRVTPPTQDAIAAVLRTVGGFMSDGESAEKKSRI